MPRAPKAEPETPPPPSSPYSKSSKTAPSPSKRSTGPSPSKSGDKNFYGEEKITGPWTVAEDKALFLMLYPKMQGINWDGIAKGVPGRDVKSCKNREVVLRKKMAEWFPGA